MLKRSNYKIFYNPNRSGVHELSVEVTPEFCDFARKQTIDHELYEKFALEKIQASGYDKINEDYDEFRQGICGWDGGLLTRIRVPGGISAATGLNLSFNLPEHPKYVSHNLDYISQASALLAIITKYLTEIELKIKDGIEGKI